jgi:hypothetical protein
MHQKVYAQAFFILTKIDSKKDAEKEDMASKRREDNEPA